MLLFWYRSLFSVPNTLSHLYVLSNNSTLIVFSGILTEVVLPF